MITLGNTKIKDVFVGSQPIKAIYQGANLIWQRITKVLRTVTGGTSVTLTDVNDNKSLVLLELEGGQSANLFDQEQYATNMAQAHTYIDNGWLITKSRDYGKLLMDGVFKANTQYSILLEVYNLTELENVGAIKITYTDGTSYTLTTASLPYNVLTSKSTTSSSSKTIQSIRMGYTYDRDIKVHLTVVEGATIPSAYIPYYGGSGDKTNNLVNTIEWANSVNIPEITSTTIGDLKILPRAYLERYNSYTPIGIVENKRYRISFDFYGIKKTESAAYTAVTLNIFYTDGTKTLSTLRIADGEDYQVKHTDFITTTDKTVDYFQFGEWAYNGELYISNFSMREYVAGAEPEPYGYKIGVLSYTQLLTKEISNKSMSGFTFTDNEDGSFTVNGIANAGRYVRVGYFDGDGSSVTFGGCPIHEENTQYALIMRKADSIVSATEVTRQYNTETVTFNTVAGTRYYLYIYIWANIQLNNARFTPIVYKSNKTPISLDTYIGSTPLGQGEKVLVDFEKQKVFKYGANMVDISRLLESQAATYDSTKQAYRVYAAYLSSLWTASNYFLSGFKPNTRYTIRTRGVGTYGSSSIGQISIKLYVHYTDGTFAQWNITKRASTSAEDDFETVVYTTEAKKSVDGIRFSHNYNVWNYISNFECFEGTTVPSEFVPYVNDDLTSLNSTLLNASQTTHEGTTVITDTSTNKVSGISATYYSRKE